MLTKIRQFAKGVIDLAASKKVDDGYPENEGEGPEEKEIHVLVHDHVTGESKFEKKGD